jgi:hypothetical protein
MCPDRVELLGDAGVDVCLAVVDERHREDG